MASERRRRRLVDLLSSRVRSGVTDSLPRRGHGQSSRTSWQSRSPCNDLLYAKRKTAAGVSPRPPGRTDLYKTSLAVSVPARVAATGMTSRVASAKTMTASATEAVATPTTEAVAASKPAEAVTASSAVAVATAATEASEAMAAAAVVGLTVSTAEGMESAGM